jgi:hypothetical protein
MVPMAVTPAARRRYLDHEANSLRTGLASPIPSIKSILPNRVGGSLVSIPAVQKLVSLGGVSKHDRLPL